jgi:hypothetical protein
MTYYSMPVRSSVPQQRWRTEADAQERKRAVAEAEARRRWEAQQREAANAAARTAEAQIAALRVELEEQYDVRREAMVQYIVVELDAVARNAERMLKRKIEALQHEFETKLASAVAAIRGERSVQGEQGAPGPMGPPGPSGPRGEQGPPGKLPVAEAWVPETVFYAGDVVAFDGGTFQARRDTGQAPSHSDWICLARAGRDGQSVKVRGTFNEAAEYHQNDLTACNGGSFIALKDAPGPCPGSGWQLVASPGKRGIAGLKGDPGLNAPVIRSWHVDRERFVVTPILAGGDAGPPLDLRSLFEEYHSQAERGRE